MRRTRGVRRTARSRAGGAPAGRALPPSPATAGARAELAVPSEAGRAADFGALAAGEAAADGRTATGAPAASSITAIAVPTTTVSPSLTRISFSTPAKGDEIGRASWRES